jgi:hypothetical protein
MLTHDTTAFVEEISVPVTDRRTDKLRRQAGSAELEVVHASVELRLAEEALRRLEERRDDEIGTAHSHVFGLMRHGSTVDLDAAARSVTELREKLAAKRERAQDLDQRVRERAAARPRNTSYRLHSEHHHATYSETQFERLFTSQRTRPVLVTTLRGVSWWWYLDRFWWDDERLAGSEVRELVLDRDRRTVGQGQAAERTRAAAIGELPPVLTGSGETPSDVVRTAVWRRDEGRCVDCGAHEDLVFDVIVPVLRGGSLNTPNIELRCRSCLASAEQRTARGDEIADARNGSGRRRSPA